MKWASLTTRAGAAVGCVVSAGWAAAFVSEIVRSHWSARTWDGVTCCDPLDDIAGLYLLTAFPLIMLAATAAVAVRSPGSLLGPLVASVHLGLGTIVSLAGPEDRLAGSGWPRRFESVAGESAVVAGLLLVIGWAMSQSIRSMVGNARVNR